MIDITKSIKACAAFYGKDADAMELYLKRVKKRL
jgi:hypothetical protein